MTINYFNGNEYEEELTIHTGLYSKKALDILRVIHACELDQDFAFDISRPYLSIAEGKKRLSKWSCGPEPFWEQILNVFRASNDEVCLAVTELYTTDLDKLHQSWNEEFLGSLKRLRRYLSTAPNKPEIVKVKLYDFYRFTPGYREKNYYNKPSDTEDKIVFVFKNVDCNDIKAMQRWLEGKDELPGDLRGHPKDSFYAGAVNESRKKVADLVFNSRDEYDIMKDRNERELDDLQNKLMNKSIQNRKYIEKAQEELCRRKKDNTRRLGEFLLAKYKEIKDLCRQLNLEEV